MSKLQDEIWSVESSMNGVARMHQEARLWFCPYQSIPVSPQETVEAVLNRVHEVLASWFSIGGAEAR
jgi:hypothetical protein